jgi:hydrogenase maturation protease
MASLRKITMKKPQILVLGVGNVLMSDEGAGVHCVQRLSHSYFFSENVRLLDGGTLGTRLLGPMSKASSLIVVDVALQGFAPGTVSRLTLDEVRSRNVEKHSMHELSFSETLSMAEAVGLLLPTTVIAIEPLDMTTVGTALTAPVAGKLEDLCCRVLDEIKTAGGSFTPQTGGARPWSFDLRIPENER